MVHRLLRSIADTTHRIEELEIVFCVDDDDSESHGINFDPLTIKTVIVPRGATMGELNRRCFETSSGRFVMLLNDDVILRTRDWDREVYAAFISFGDDIGLVHVNDLLFRERLCTFPILSRQACSAIGICPGEYARYRIDDHIYDTYNMLAFLGYPRIAYLPEVIFEHLNHQVVSKEKGEKFVSEDNKVYLPNQDILKSDARIFDSLIETRKKDAITLATLIEEISVARKNSHAREQVKKITDQFGYRSTEFVRVIPRSADAEPAKHAAISVAVVTSDVYKPHAQKCISSLKKYTSCLDLIILDNNGSKDFNHAREMNRAMRTAKTDLLVLMDDDVFVQQGRLDGHLESMDCETAVVGPLHQDANEKISHSGVYLSGDEWGRHAHLLDVPDEPRVVQCLCSACLLIDLSKTRGIFFDERYGKYFHDLDHSLKVWEAGYKVVCTPRSIVTHLAGATMPHGSAISTLLWNKDIQIFAADWIRSGRLKRLQTGIFSRFPFLVLMSYIPARIQSVVQEDTWEFSKFAAEVKELESICARLPLFQTLLVHEISACLARCRDRGDELKAKFCEDILDRTKNVPVAASGPVPVLLEPYKGYNLVQYLEDVLIVPQSLGPVNLANGRERERVDILVATSLGSAKATVDGIVTSSDKLGSAVAVPQVLESYEGYNIVGYRNEVLVIPTSLGPVNLTSDDDRKRPEIFKVSSVDAGRSAVDALLGGNPSALPANTPLLLRRYRSHNIVRLNKRVLGVPISLGPIDVTEDTVRAIPQIINGNSMENVLAAIDRIPAAPWRMANGSSPAVVQTQEPLLAVQGYKRFNLFLLSGKYYGILKADGAFYPALIFAKHYTCIFAADTLPELKSRIDRIPLIWRLGFRIKPILVTRPFLWRTVQKLNRVLIGGVS